MTQQEAEATILEFVRKVIHPSIEVDTLLVEEGLMDSFDAVEVIDFIEEKFSLRVDPASISREDVVSVKAMASFAMRALAERSAAPIE